MIKLNLGCGIMHKAGFINIDKYITKEYILALIEKGVYKDTLIEEGSEYLQADILKLPFEDNYADLIEAIDVIEHFGFDDVQVMLNEVKRVLKPGGTAKFITVDFNGLAVEWSKKIANAIKVDMNDYVDLMQAVYGNQLNDGNYHKSAWTPAYAYQVFVHDIGFDADKFNVIVYPQYNTERASMETSPWREGCYQLHQALLISVTK